MHNPFRNLRLTQLDRLTQPFQEAAKTPRPPKGWLRAVREATGISSAEIARFLNTSRQLQFQQEKAEAEDRITLKSLRFSANAMGCDLVYALVPRTGTFKDLVEDREQTKAKKRVASVEHSMALEDQAAGHVDEAVAAETKRRLTKRGLR